MSYKKLCAIHQEITLLNTAKSTLSWDQETYIPENAHGFRSKQLGYFSTQIHNLSTSKEYASALEKAESEGIESDAQRINIREWRHEFEKVSKLPEELVQRDSEARSSAMPFWKKAQASGDFSIFSSKLETLIDIAKEKADLLGYEDEAYSALLCNYERGANTTEVEEIFSNCSESLISIAEQATGRSANNPPRKLDGHFPISKQQELNQLVAESMGFDFKRGRIDTTTHPFCSTHGPNDIRLTTRYNESNFLPSLFGVMHEAGHGIYEQGLIADEFGRPAGSAISLSIHESQSLLWENHVGRSKPFWEKWLPIAADLFPQLKDWSTDEIHQHINTANYSFIRVDADEATYDLHILLRFKVERMIINGELAVKDIPDTWNNLSEQYFGIRPESDSNGCLQDVHWSFGLFGYFSTYSLGNFNASQLMHTALHDTEIKRGYETAEYAPLLKWLRGSIHQPGSTFLPQQLMKEVTGSVTDPTYHLEHLKSRFL